jgi:hypothetical protein
MEPLRERIVKSIWHIGLAILHAKEFKNRTNTTGRIMTACAIAFHFDAAIGDLIGKPTAFHFILGGK